MLSTRRWAMLCAVGLGLGVSGLTGCQTWEDGMTLPSGRYLDHPPQYFPPDPDFPLPRELASQEEAAGLIRPLPQPGLELNPQGVVPGAPVPGIPAPIPAPAPVPGGLGGN